VSILCAVFVVSALTPTHRGMKARVSHWCSLDNLGWTSPGREPLSKAELIEEKRLHDNMIEARKHATVEELQIPCRSIRVVLGYKI
jgi:hypothetical protein